MPGGKGVPAALAPLVGVTALIRAFATRDVLERIRGNTSQACGFEHCPRLPATVLIVDQSGVAPGRHQHGGGWHRVLRISGVRLYPLEFDEMSSYLRVVVMSGGDRRQRTAEPSPVVVIPVQRCGEVAPDVGADATIGHFRRGRRRGGYVH